MQMTYRKAIIILDRLVTTERIEVDREELREAVKVAKAAMQKQIAEVPKADKRYYGNCGQALDWT